MLKNRAITLVFLVSLEISIFSQEYVLSPEGLRISPDIVIQLDATYDEAVASLGAPDYKYDNPSGYSIFYQKYGMELFFSDNKINMISAISPEAYADIGEVKPLDFSISLGKTILTSKSTIVDFFTSKELSPRVTSIREATRYVELEFMVEMAVKVRIRFLKKDGMPIFSIGIYR